ncbi:hypothetical protein N581_02290 [Lactobacillus jensenii MD IIE-70(2)]|nr:hypothetical protein N581_02290 [Lactobacillus jensenii MD IIE-70(2)]
MCHFANLSILENKSPKAWAQGLKIAPAGPSGLDVKIHLD